MSNKKQFEEKAPHGNGGSRALTITLESDPRVREAGGDQTQTQRALFQWAERVLEDAGLLKLLRDAKTREQLDAIKFEPGNLTLIMMIRDALHPGSGRSRERHFRHLSEKMLTAILRNRFTEYKKGRKRS